MSMVFVATALAVMPTVSAYSSYQQGKSAKEAADYNAEMQRQSAQM